MEERRGGCVLGGRHRVRQPPRPDRDGRPEDVARLKLPAVDPETSRDVIDSHSRCRLAADASGTTSTSKVRKGTP